jgi:hypothetical protein
VLTSSSRGSVTAELVLTLPAITLVIALAVGALSVQLQTFQLVGTASMVAKAIARGEGSEVVDELVSQAGQRVRFELFETQNSVCVNLSLGVKLPGFQFQVINLSETQCARAQGQ